MNAFQSFQPFKTFKQFPAQWSVSDHLSQRRKGAKFGKG